MGRLSCDRTSKELSYAHDFGFSNIGVKQGGVSYCDLEEREVFKFYENNASKLIEMNT